MSEGIYAVTAVVNEIRSHNVTVKGGRVTACYDSGGTLGSFTFDVDAATAQRIHLGQRLRLVVVVADDR